MTETAVEGESETATETVTETGIEAEIVTDLLLRCQSTDRIPDVAATLQKCSQSRGRRDSKREMKRKMR